MPYIDWHGNEIEDGEADAVARDNRLMLLAEAEDGFTRTVQAALSLDRHALYYRVRLDPAEARSFALKQGGDGILAVLLDEIDEAIPVQDYGPDNPNTGLPAQTYEVGREYSRVVYLDWPRSYAPDGFDWPALEARLREIAEERGRMNTGRRRTAPSASATASGGIENLAIQSLAIQSLAIQSLALGAGASMITRKSKRKEIDSMTVGDMKAELDDYGDHLEIKVVKDGKHRDTFFSVVQVGATQTPSGESVVQIEIDQAD